MSLIVNEDYITIPSVTTTERNALTAANGMLVYDTTLNQFYKYENGAWSAFGGGSSYSRTVINGNTTAANDTDYTLVSSSTITDPSPVEGKGYSVLLRNGTATIGGTAYSTVGQLLWRVYHSGAWATYQLTTQTQLDNRPVLISTATASTTAVVDFTLPSGYNSFELKCINVVPSTDSVGMWLRVSTDGGATFAAGASDYSFQRYLQNSTTPFYLVQTDSKLFLQGSSISNMVGRYHNSTFKIYNPSNTNSYKNISGESFTYRDDTIYTISIMNGVYLSNTAVNAIRILMSSGNIASGTFELWGYK